MKISVEKLNQIIREELEDELLKEKDKKKDKKKKKACDDVAGNWAHRKSDGKFSNNTTDNCHSKYFACPEGGRSRSNAGSNKRLAISNPSKSGRRPDREFKCSTNKKVKNENTITKSELERIVREELDSFNLSEIMPKKPAWQKRKKRREYDDEQVRQDRYDAKTGRNSLKKELEKIRRPLKRAANGIFQEDSILKMTNEDDEHIRIKLIALEALRDALEEIASFDLDEDVETDDDARLDNLYDYHKGKADKKKKLIMLKKKLCPPCPKGASVGSLANNINSVALALKAKLHDKPKSD